MEDAEDTTTAMAQAMGFSSFGAQNNSNKRRKFNPRADAVVASSSTPTDAHHHNSVAQRVESGSNATPLGVRTRNEDEIDLEGGEDEANASTTGGRDNLNNAGNSGPGPQYLNTSRPPAAIALDFNDYGQSRMDSILGVSSHQLIAGPSSFGGPSIPRRGGGYHPNRGRGHESGKEWWEDYYDPSSNVNPWEQLEQTKGLGPRGRWMSWEEAKG